MDKPEFLYHGSSNRVDILIPYQSADFLNASGSQNAVLATTNRDVALAFALGTVPDETGDDVTRVILSLDPVKMIFVRGCPNLGGKGYLYNLAGDKFDQVDSAQ